VTGVAGPARTSVLQEIADALRAEGGLLGAAARDPQPGAPAPHAGRVVTDLHAFVVEAVFEGHLAHHGTARVVDQDDRDLALLIGDRLYALGLERLAAAGDLVAVRALADTIALGAMAVAAGDPELEAAVWEAGVAEVAGATSPALRQGKNAARRGDPGAAQALRAAVRQDPHDVAHRHPSGGRTTAQRPVT
jgi:hypothetical protein